MMYFENTQHGMWKIKCILLQYTKQSIELTRILKTVFNLFNKLKSTVELSRN